MKGEFSMRVRMLHAFGLLCLACCSTSSVVGQDASPDANPHASDAFESRLQRLLEINVAQNKQSLAAAKTEYRELATVQSSPRLDFAMAIVLFRGDETSEAVTYARKAWNGSDPKMLSSARILLRCLLTAKKYREAIALIKELTEMAQVAGIENEQKLQLAETVGSTMKLLETIDDLNSKSIENARDELEAEIRALPDLDFHSAYLDARNQLAAVFQDAEPVAGANKNATEELATKLDSREAKIQAAEAYKAMLNAKKEDQVKLLESRLNAVDATLAEAEKQYKQLAPLIEPAANYVESLNLAYGVTGGGVESAVVNGRSLTGAQIKAELQISAAKLNTLRAGVARISAIAEAATVERMAISSQYKTLTGQAAKVDANIEALQAKLQQQKERLKKESKSKQSPEVLKKQIAQALPINVDEMILELQAP